MSNSQNKQTPFFSVVIPTYERPDDLRRCLNSLKPENQQDAPVYEIIVTDDSRSDLCRILVEKEFPQVSWGKGKQNGPAGNRNAGVARAQGEWIVFIDDDCIAQTGYLSAYSKAIRENPSVGVLEGRIFPDRPRKTWAEGCPANENGGLFWTSNLCVRKSIFEKLGGLDEQFEVAYEDVDFARRLRQAEARSFFVYEAAACHPWRSVRKGGNNWKARNYESADFIRFLKKHRPKEREFTFSGYTRNLARMLTSDLRTCACAYNCRGIDILFFQTIVTLRSMFLIFRHNRRSLR
ncbi:MAG: glycosyltransferase [Opitutae bacterium]|jgi:GT2 family glycosyltransferase|nr:glycosyltransferase [Opitutae bacterium]